MRLISMMKIMNRMMRIGGAMALLMAATGCVNEEPAYVEPVEPETAEMGYLSLSEVGLLVVSDSETDQSTEEPSIAMLSRADDLTFDSEIGAYKGNEASDKEDYRVTIRSEKGDVVFHNTLAELKKQVNSDKGGLEVPVGRYTISATSNPSATGVPAVVQDSPSYAGKVDGINVVKDETAQAGTIVCKLQNIKITVGVAADLYSQLVPLSTGNLIDAEVYYADSEIDWLVPATWNWTAETPKPVYFPVLKEDETLHFRFRAKIKGGSDIEITRDISDVMEGQWRRVHVAPQYDTEGNVVLDVKVSAFAPDETIKVNGENGGDGAGDGAAPTICWTELALDKSSGEPSIKWADGTELPESIAAASQPVTIAAPNGIERVGLTVRTTNSEFTADAAAMTKDDLCAVASNRQLTNYGIPFGAALKGQKEVPFGLDKILGQIRGYDGEYTFDFTVTDQNGFTCQQTLKFVSGSGSVFEPITIEGDGFNIDERQNVLADGSIELANGEKSKEVKVNVHCPKKITELWVSINSETLTPTLGEFGIPQTFDLCALDEQMAALMSGFGFPCNDEVRGQTEILFRISSSLMGLLSGIEGDHDFVLKVVSEGESVSKTIKLHV